MSPGQGQGVLAGRDQLDGLHPRRFSGILSWVLQLVGLGNVPASVTPRETPPGHRLADAVLAAMGVVARRKRPVSWASSMGTGFAVGLERLPGAQADSAR